MLLLLYKLNDTINTDWFRGIDRRALLIAWRLFPNLLGFLGSLEHQDLTQSLLARSHIRRTPQ